MGSFNATCIVSNLPIEAGTPVRFLALARNAFAPDGNGHECYVTGRWQLHGVPIQGKYNDYGSVEEVVDNFTTQLFFKGLALTAVEIGTGDNSCHDVPVRSDMDQASWLEALWEGRVKVDDSRAQNRRLKEAKELDQKLEEMTGKVTNFADWFGPKGYEPEVGIPTFRRIERLLSEAGYKLSSGGFDTGFLVDEVGSGFVRVRSGSLSEHTGDLSPAMNLLHGAGYAAMVTAGSGSYANGKPEILVAALPSTDPKVHINVNHDDINDLLRKARPVSQAMIREDVWQILLNTPIDSWSEKYDIEVFRSEALRALDQELAKIAELKEAKASGDATKVGRLAWRMEDDTARENIFRDSLRGSEGVSGFNFREAFRLAIDTADTAESMREYVLALAETVYVQWVYSILHGQWHPTTNSGQDGNWKEHRTFLTELLKIKGRYEDDEEDLDEDTEED